jgi:hypothetical protein
VKLLLDESLDVDLRHELVGHDVYTVSYMRWKGSRNGALLAAAAADGFDALITIDRDIEHQQNLSTLPCAIYVLMAQSDIIDDLKALVPNLLNALSQRPQKKIYHIQP